LGLLHGIVFFSQFYTPSENNKAMTNKKEITICLGSSCFSRGNKKTLEAINNYLKQHKLEDQVFFHGELCTNNCAQGPVLKIGEQIYENVDSIGVIDILNAYFEP
jgi:NADH:ubiquinone oxidoreductase subunit E